MHEIENRRRKRIYQIKKAKDNTNAKTTNLDNSLCLSLHVCVCVRVGQILTRLRTRFI